MVPCFALNEISKALAAIYVSPRKHTREHYRHDHHKDYFFLFVLERAFPDLRSCEVGSPNPGSLREPERTRIYPAALPGEVLLDITLGVHVPI